MDSSDFLFLSLVCTGLVLLASIFAGTGNRRNAQEHGKTRCLAALHAHHAPSRHANARPASTRDQSQGAVDTLHRECFQLKMCFEKIRLILLKKIFFSFI